MVMECYTEFVRSFLPSLPLLLLLFSPVVCVIQLFGMAKNQSSRLSSFLSSSLLFSLFLSCLFFFLFIYLFIYLFLFLFIVSLPLSSLVKKTLPHGIEPWTQRLTAARSTLAKKTLPHGIEPWTQRLTAARSTN